MRVRHGWAIGALIAAGLLLPSCTRSSGETATVREPATVEAIEGSDVSRITLSADAAKRLGVETSPVREAPTGSGDADLVVPYAAVVYDAAGRTWVYANPDPLVFVRAEIRVDRIEGQDAFLSGGPPSGTQVVTVGAAELYGTEYGVGQE